ncbi:MAG: nucleotidyltransferase domain-containing protein [Acetobacteraceae bacterium]|nr:nucleotidyltransferase domain-containing protein [Acetobacteraceae bacterium]
MSRAEVIAILRAHEPELRTAGVVSLSLFGSVARGEAQAGSDIDVVVRLREDILRTGFAYFGRLAAVSRMLQQADN